MTVTYETKNIGLDSEILKKRYHISRKKTGNYWRSKVNINDNIMKDQKKLSDNTSNQPSKFRAKNLFEINDDLGGTCNTNSQINFKNSNLKRYIYIC